MALTFKNLKQNKQTKIETETKAEQNKKQTLVILNPKLLSI